ncbi:MAG: hypothetical protein ACLQVD_13730 [Capsulimonadaceae bacterium]
MRIHLRRRVRLRILLSALVACWFAGCAPQTSLPPGLPTFTDDATINYHGHSIVLSNHYQNFASYKADPDNIPVDELEQVAKWVEEQPAPKSCSSWDQAALAFQVIQFPGYGLRFVHSPRSSLTVLSGAAVELPRTGRERFIIYRRNDSGGFTRIDDFVFPRSRGRISSVVYNDGRYVYHDSQGNTLRQHS